jgi:hypothetical protein
LFLLGWKMIDMLLLHCNTPTTQEVWCEAMLPDWSCVWHLVELAEAIMIAFKLRFKVFFGASYVFWGPIDALFLDQVCFSHLRFLHANYPDRCVFSNITDFVKSADVKISKMRLVSWHCLGKVWLKAFPLTPGHVFFLHWVWEMARYQTHGAKRTGECVPADLPLQQALKTLLLRVLHVWLSPGA